MIKIKSNENNNNEIVSIFDESIFVDGFSFLNYENIKISNKADEFLIKNKFKNKKIFYSCKNLIDISINSWASPCSNKNIYTLYKKDSFLPMKIYKIYNNTPIIVSCFNDYNDDDDDDDDDRNYNKEIYNKIDLISYNKLKKQNNTVFLKDNVDLSSLEKAILLKYYSIANEPSNNNNNNNNNEKKIKIKISFKLYEKIYEYFYEKFDRIWFNFDLQNKLIEKENKEIYLNDELVNIPNYLTGIYSLNSLNFC